jgi:hypothetical protein
VEISLNFRVKKKHSDELANTRYSLYSFKLPPHFQAIAVTASRIAKTDMGCFAVILGCDDAICERMADGTRFGQLCCDGSTVCGW